jgi:ribonuclease Z
MDMRILKWVIIAIVAIGAVLFAVANLFKAQIGERIYATAVERAISTNLMADLPDGLHVILLGTGSPLGDPSRMGPSTIVIAGSRVFVIDAGSGSPRNFGQVGVSPGAIEAVFLTHFHSDHIDSLGELMLQRWVGGAHTAPLPVYGPQGVEQVIEGFNLSYRQDHFYRTAHHGADVAPPTGAGGEAIPFRSTAPSETLIDDGELKVMAFRVDHSPVEPAVGYRFDYKGRSVTLTGDTARTPAIAQAAKGSDLLVSEALNAEMVGVMQAGFEKVENKRLAKIMFDIPDYHITPVEAAEIASEAGVKVLALSHIVPAVPTPYLNAYYLKGASDAFEGDIVLGQDGMLFTMPAGGSVISQEQLK